MSNDRTFVSAGEDWWDLCAGPHVEHTGQLPVKAIELETVAGAYWRGDENRQQLQRIYGTAWENGERTVLCNRGSLEGVWQNFHV